MSHHAKEEAKERIRKLVEVTKKYIEECQNAESSDSSGSGTDKMARHNFQPYGLV